MPFQFLNDPETSAPADQIEPDARDFEIMLAGFLNTGVVTNCAVTQRGAGANQSVDVASGTVMIGGRRVTVTGANLPLAAADVTNPRIDLITVDTAGTIAYTNGTAAADPVYPTLPASKVILAQVFRAANDNTVETADITDKRVMLAVATDEQHRYVSKNGNDSNDGLTWETAKATLAGAVASLPVAGGNTPYGVIDVGRGTFTETSTPINIYGSILIRGSGRGSGATEHTVIKLGNSRNTHLIQTPGGSASAHGLHIENLTFDGNKANQDGGDYDLLRVDAGFGMTLQNVAFVSATRWAIVLTSAPMNYYFQNLTFSGCGGATKGGCIYNTGLAGGVFLLDGAQLDVCGVYPFFWEHTSTAAGHIAVFKNIKAEMQDADTTLHANVFRFKPRVSAGGNPPKYVIEDCFLQHNSGTTDQHPAAIYEESQSGVGAYFTIRNIYCNATYQKAFTSAKINRSSLGKSIRLLVDGDVAGERPLEIDGVVFDTGTGAPSTGDGLPIGSLYMRRDGASGTTLYVKDGASQWTAITGSFPGYGASGYPMDVAAAEADGTASLVARSDHVHKGSPYPLDTSGAVMYVSKGGNDSNDGKTWGSAKLTIQSAYDDLPDYVNDATPAGGVIYVSDGRFDVGSGLVFDRRKAVHIIGVNQHRRHNSGTSWTWGGTVLTRSAASYPALGANFHAANRAIISYGTADTTLIGSGFTYENLDFELLDPTNAGMTAVVDNYAINHPQFINCGVESLNNSGVFVYNENDTGGTYDASWGRIQRCFVSNASLFYNEYGHTCDGWVIRDNVNFGSATQSYDAIYADRTTRIRIEGNDIHWAATAKWAIHLPSAWGAYVAGNAGEGTQQFCLIDVGSNGGSRGCYVNNPGRMDSGGGASDINLKFDGSNTNHNFGIVNFAMAPAGATGYFTDTSTSGVGHTLNSVMGIGSAAGNVNPNLYLPHIKRGANTPAGTINGNVGDLYMRSNGGAGTALYVKEAGDNNNTGWVPVSTLAGSTFSMSASIKSPAADDFFVWRAPFACTLTNLRAYQDTGTGTVVNAFKGSLASPTLFRATAYTITAADTIEDAGSLQNTSIAAGDKVYLRVTSVAGSPNEIGIQLDLTRT